MQSKYEIKNVIYGIVKRSSQTFQYTRVLIRMQNQWFVHNAGRCVARKCVVYIQKWSGGRSRDALPATVTPHVHTSA